MDCYDIYLNILDELIKIESLEHRIRFYQTFCKYCAAHVEITIECRQDYGQCYKQFYETYFRIQDICDQTLSTCVGSPMIKNEIVELECVKYCSNLFIKISSCSFTLDDDFVTEEWQKNMFEHLYKYANFSLVKTKKLIIIRDNLRWETSRDDIYSTELKKMEEIYICLDYKIEFFSSLCKLFERHITNLSANTFEGCDVKQLIETNAKIYMILDNMMFCSLKSTGETAKIYKIEGKKRAYKMLENFYLNNFSKDKFISKEFQINQCKIFLIKGKISLKKCELYG